MALKIFGRQYNQLEPISVWMLNKYVTQYATEILMENIFMIIQSKKLGGLADIG